MVVEHNPKRPFDKVAKAVMNQVPRDWHGRETLQKCYDFTLNLEADDVEKYALFAGSLHQGLGYPPDCGWKETIRRIMNNEADYREYLCE